MRGVSASRFSDRFELLYFLFSGRTTEHGVASKQSRNRHIPYSALLSFRFAAFPISSIGYPRLRPKRCIKDYASALHLVNE